ncbi:MAG: DHH family phosphoesterase [Lachnospiraceae bacterium]|nr:DHH family phosphoesterase [Lachnospiraceae bacterium]
MRWPLILTVIVACMDSVLFVVNKKAGFVGILFFVIYAICAALIWRYRNRGMFGDLVRYAAGYGRVQKQLLKEMALPYAVLDCKGALLWANDEFLDIIAEEKLARKHISNVIPELQPQVFPKNEQDVEAHVTVKERDYRVVMRRIEVPVATAAQQKGFDPEIESLGRNGMIITVHLYDETEINAYIRQNEEEKMVAGLLYIDNFEETLGSVDEVRRSLLLALVERKINKYMNGMDAIVKKLEKDKYFFVFRQKFLPRLTDEKFAILAEVQTVNVGNEMPVTISIGLGADGENYSINYENARAAIDLALGRGGDQAVVKRGEKISYFGGKTMQVEKTTRVKARVKAHALKELMESKNNVVVMGHSIGDVDSFGAAIGIYRIAKTLEKRAYIVINEVTSSVKPVMDRFIDNPDYEEDLIINGERAKEIVDDDTLLVIVDVNRPSYTECEELLDMTRTVVILDHHRRTDEAIKNPVLSYIEPYASSACEMVAEILQYVGEGIKLKQAEADAMYSGIMIDTDNFLVKTGVRTFEAAAFLRRHGADVTRIRKGFRSDIKEYKIRAEAIAHAEIYKNAYTITECKAQGIKSPTVLGAQVANELLDIKGVKASFVLTDYNDKIYISARSIDEVNVQTIMERLGGGGHMSVAGAQLHGFTMEEARGVIKKTLDDMIKGGDI